MVSREQVIELYRLILDRSPESDAVIDQKRSASSIAHLAVDMLTSDEFFNANVDLLKRLVRTEATQPDS